MNFKKVSQEVFYTDDTVVNIGLEDIERLKKISNNNKRKRSRICTHPEEKDLLHEMIIVHRNDTYVRPHKHLQKSESFYIIEGSASIFIFNEDGDVSQVIKMGSYLSGDKFYCRLPKMSYHTFIITSDIIVFHECTSGPFKKNETVYAPWSPSEDRHNEVNRFMSRLSALIE